MFPIDHWSQVPWQPTRWPHVVPRELACHCCGEICLWPEALDAIEALRCAIGAPLVITSGHRCARHNRQVGGAPNSVHRSLAFDIALGGMRRAALLDASRKAGFLRFGLMRHGLHCDIHPPDPHHAPMWTYGAESRRLWAGLFPPGTPDIGQH